MKKNTLIFALALLASSSFGQSLKEHIEAAITNFPKLKELQGNIALANEKIQLAKAGYQPNIALNGSYNYVAPVSKANFLGNEIQFQPNNNFNAYLSVNQTIWDFGRTTAAVEKAKEDKQQVIDNLASNEMLLAYQIAQIFNNIVLLNKNIALQNDQIALAKNNYKLIENKVKNGDALNYDLINADVRIKIAENKKIDLQNQLNKQTALLRFYTGNSSATVVADNFESLESSSATFNQNTDVILANDRLSSARKDFKNSVSNFLPNLFFNGNAGWKNMYLPNINELRFNYVLGAGITIPIYDGGRAIAQRKLAKLAIETAQQNLTYTEQNANKDWEQAKADLEANQVRLQNTQAIVKQAEAAFALAQSRYQNGTLTWLDLENARVNVEDTKFSLVQLEYQIAQNNLELNRLTGKRFWQAKY